MEGVSKRIAGAKNDKFSGIAVLARAEEPALLAATASRRAGCARQNRSAESVAGLTLVMPPIACKTIPSL